MKTIFNVSIFLAAAVVLVGTSEAKPEIPLKVVSSNIRSSAKERDPENNWLARRDDLVEVLKSIKADVMGFQELSLLRRKFLATHFPDHEFIGDFRQANKIAGEGTAIAYNSKRFALIKTETFWLSETPDVPGSRSWGGQASISGYPRICTWALFRDLETDGLFCFANTHLDLKADCRYEGMKLIIKRLEKFIKKGIPVMLTGDMNANELENTSIEARKVFNDSAMSVKRKIKGPWRTYTGFGYIPPEREHSAQKVFERSPRDRNDPKFRFGGRIDYIYSSKNITVSDFAVRNDPRLNLKRYPSDHYPVEADLLLPVKKLSSAQVEALLNAK